MAQANMKLTVKTPNLEVFQRQARFRQHLPAVDNQSLFPNIAHPASSEVERRTGYFLQFAHMPALLDHVALLRNNLHSVQSEESQSVRLAKRTEHMGVQNND